MRAIAIIGILFIFVVSMIDNLWTYINRDIMLETEQNPIGMWLLTIAGGSVWLFIIVKTITTALACILMAILYRYRTDMGITVIIGVSLAQAALLWYLYFGHLIA